MAEAGVEAGLPADPRHAARPCDRGRRRRPWSTSLTEPAATLRQNVTSPGGTTQEALRVLMAEDGLQPLLTKAIAAAHRARSRELG